MLVDTLSFTRAGVSWINHSWLAQVVMALLFRAGGYLALTILVAGLAVFSMVMVYRQMEAPPLWRAFVVVLAALVVAPVWSARPQLFSLALLVVLNGLLERWQRQGQGRFYLLAPLFVLWSNLHGGYPLGIALLGCVIAGNILDRLLGREGSLSGRQVRSLSGWTALSFLAVAINPNGINMWRIPFQTVGVGILQKAIPEWASPDFHDLVQAPFLVMLALLIVALGLSGKPARGSDLFKVIVFAALGLEARRNFGPFALLAAPILADSGWAVVERLREGNGLLARTPLFSGESKPLSAGFQRTFNLGIIGLLAFVAYGKLYAVSYPALVESYLRETFPSGAVDWLKANHPAGRLFNEYSWGGYLTWTLTDYPVFVDGRTDLFGDEIIGQWLDVTNGAQGWQGILAKWDVNLALLAPGEPVLREMEEVGWKVLYQDPVSVLVGK
jgi:hypothetical protein